MIRSQKKVLRRRTVTLTLVHVYEGEVNRNEIVDVTDLGFQIFLGGNHDSTVPSFG